MSAIDGLQQAAFGGIPFPIKSCRVVGGLRDHVHEFPKSPGGAPEKLGRKLYAITMDALFVDNAKAYPDLWPDNLYALTQRFENQETWDLVVPNIGTIDAYCFNWTRELNGRMRSGETAQLEFREDAGNLYLVENLIQAQGRSLPADAAALEAEAAALGLSSSFESLLSAIGDVTAFFDSITEFGSGIQTQLDDIEGAFAELDRSVKALGDPANYALFEAFSVAWDSSVTLNQNLKKRADPVVRYVTPRIMAIGEVSRELYGDASRASDLLVINAIEDPYSIPAGARLRVYAQRATKAR